MHLGRKLGGDGSAEARRLRSMAAQYYSRLWVRGSGMLWHDCDYLPVKFYGLVDGVEHCVGIAGHWVSLDVDVALAV